MTDGAPQPTALWLDPCFGASGDMLLGVLTGLGADLAKTIDELSRLDIPEWTLQQQTTNRCSLSSNRVVVSTADSSHHRSWSSIDRLIAESGIETFANDGARQTFRRLAEAEAAIHNVAIDDVHFHEVGAVDAIVDIVGSWIALAQLRSAYNITEVVAGPIGLGHGTVMAAHGTLPLPAPATATLLRNFPVQALDAVGETVTPTGAALLVTMADRSGHIPAGVLVANSRGAGGRDPEHYPNVISGYLLAINDGK